MDTGSDIAAKEAEGIMVPAEYRYTYQDFLESSEPYEKLYSYFGLPFVMEREVIKMTNNAKRVNFNNFKSVWKRFLELKDSERKQQLSVIPNQTEFDGQILELSCGGWESTDWGIYRLNRFGAKEYACAHPIQPVERLVNIDTGEVKLKLRFKRSGHDQRWATIVVGKDVVSNARKIVDALSPVGISVTTETAKALVAYLNDVENANYNVIPERKAIGRLGYIQGEGFSPFVEGLVFDGDESYRHLYETIKTRGSEIEWFHTALECRKMSVTARILLAASFASPILSLVGSLPFFVHLWGEASGTGKTVALMLAASVWGDPLKGKYMQTFNATQVGQERTAAFLNHLPFCIDELQLTKDGKGKTNFDVYQLAEGVGRVRGKRNGGNERTATWDCCFLTTGESPLVSVASGAGAINRVIEIECVSGEAVIVDGKRISRILKQNYGFAGPVFVKKLYESETVQNQVKEIYDDFFADLSQGDSTEKQAMAAAAILTGDLLATHWIFGDNMELTVKDIREFLASKEAVSAGKRAYDWLCDWVAGNYNKFVKDGETLPTGDICGKLEGETAYIIRSAFRKALEDAGFSESATLSYLKANNLIETRGRAYTKDKRITKDLRRECVVLRTSWTADISDDDLLPL